MIISASNPRFDIAPLSRLHRRASNENLSFRIFFQRTHLHKNYLEHFALSPFSYQKVTIDFCEVKSKGCASRTYSNDN
jgi:hypothetical protein